MLRAERIAAFHEGYSRPSDEECWLWKGSTSTGGGYATFRIGGDKAALAHRISYELAHGEIPKDMVVDHLCRVRHCVNPSHLRLVTRGQNTLENSNSPSAINSKKTHCSRGHPYDADNTYRTPNGYRRCVTCRRAETVARSKRGEAA